MKQQGNSTQHRIFALGIKSEARERGRAAARQGIECLAKECLPRERDGKPAERFKSGRGNLQSRDIIPREENIPAAAGTTDWRGQGRGLGASRKDAPHRCPGERPQRPGPGTAKRGREAHASEENTRS